MILLILFVLVIPVALWWTYANTNPSVTIPTPTLPSPNAFDYFVAAGNAVVDSDKIGYAIAPPNSPHTNKGPDHVYTPAEQATLVQENAGALRTLRQGFAFPYQSPPARSFNARFHYYVQFRGMARLLRLEGETEETQGDWAEAVNSHLDAVEIGEKMPRGGTLIGMLVSIACQAIGRRPLWADVDHLDAAQAKAAARRLERLSAAQVSYAEVMQQEKWEIQASLMEVFRGPDWGATFAEMGHPDSKITLDMIEERFIMDLTPKRYVMGAYTGDMDRIIADARQPYAARPHLWVTPTEQISAILCPDSTKASLKYTDNEAQNSLLLVTLALRAYRLEHGAYPATLTALVPAYLSRVPDDPFALSGPLRYKPQGAAYLLYSVGPDGRDDGGRAIFDASKPAPASRESSDPRRFVQPDSQGDIVAGVNIQ